VDGEKSLQNVPCPSDIERLRPSLADVARGGADNTGIQGAVDAVGVALGAMEALKGDGGGPEVTECSCQWGWGTG
jgi:hypothetical protein